jgi:polyhydroxyalkanoate synthase
MNDQAPITAAKAGPVDAEIFARNLARMIEEGGKALAAYLHPRETGEIKSEFADQITDAIKTLGEVVEYWLADPQRALELQATLGKAYLDLWGSAVRRMTGEPGPPVTQPDPKDRRFADPEWSSNQFFDFIKQAYLLTSQFADRLVKDAEALDPHTRQKAAFYVKQIANAISPSNFVLTNPELLRETVGSNAENLVRGMHMLAEDIRAGHGDLKIRQSDPTIFALGRNLALTPGKVIYQNDLMQLIQYTPTTGKVLKRPLLIVPPWINKFYILDLTPDKSFIKCCVDQGLTVFVISWVNPDARLAQKSFEDYMHEGVLERNQGPCHRLLRRRHVAGDHARLPRGEAPRAGAIGDILRRAGRLHARGRPPGLRRRSAARGARAADGRARISRRQEDGDRIQYVAVERPSLALCHQ